MDYYSALLCVCPTLHLALTFYPLLHGSVRIRTVQANLRAKLTRLTHPHDCAGIQIAVAAVAHLDAVLAVQPRSFPLNNAGTA